MKTSFFVECYGKQAAEKDLVAKIKELWAADGHLIKDIKTINLYAKPEESLCYYTINDEINGQIDLF